MGALGAGQPQGARINFLFASDGIEALAMLEANSDIDMVVADINMPRMDGLTLLQKLRESAEYVSTIIVSAYGDMSNIRAAINRGAFEFVTKPIDRVSRGTQIPIVQAAPPTLSHRGFFH